MEKLDVRAFQRFNIDIQGFPFENFSGGHFGKLMGGGGGIYTDFWWGQWFTQALFVHRSAAEKLNL